MAVAGQDYALIASDTRLTDGGYGILSRTTPKLFQVGTLLLKGREKEKFGLPLLVHKQLFLLAARLLHLMLVPIFFFEFVTLLLKWIFSANSSKFCS